MIMWIAVGLGKSDSTPECETVFGVGAGDTCFAVTQAFNLTTEFFSALNPNLNCEALFVGEWLCVDGTVNWADDVLSCNEENQKLFYIYE